MTDQQPDVGQPQLTNVIQGASDLLENPLFLITLTFLSSSLVLRLNHELLVSYFTDRYKSIFHVFRTIDWFLIRQSDSVYYIVDHMTLFLVETLIMNLIMIVFKPMGCGWFHCRIKSVGMLVLYITALTINMLHCFCLSVPLSFFKTKALGLITTLI